jgi:MFS family permease
LFYGWYIVAAGILLSGYNGIVSVYGFTAFIEPIAKTFGWSYAQISLATSLRGLESGALTPLMGFLVDRYPPRRLALLGVIILAVGYGCFGRATNLLFFYVSFIIIGFGSSLAIVMVPQTILVRWFRRDLGKASGALFLGNGISGLFVPILVFGIDRYGWQTCLIFFAMGLLIIGIPASLMFRTRPEEHGLVPDGRTRDPIQSSIVSRQHIRNISVKQALRMRAFWHMGVANILLTGAWAAYATHLIPYFSSLGIDRSVGGNTTMALALVSLAARFLFGWLSDIYDKRYVMASCFVFHSLALFIFWLINGPSFFLIALFVILIGIGTGGIMPIRIPLFREYFGVAHFGKIYGMGNMFITIGIICGAPFAGWVYDTWGTYDPAWFVLIFLTGIGAVLMLTMPSAKHNGRVDSKIPLKM